MIFRYTILYVDDVCATLDFYQRAFGLERGFLHPSQDYGELITGDTKLAFSSRQLMKELGKNPKAPEPGAPSFEIAFESEDVPSALDTALAAGAVLVQPLREEPWGQSTSYVSDPNGFLIEICSPLRDPQSD
ncbi:MAG: glyoxalase [Planctomycetota bacterium]|nr:MAG: glyoxalase [Planctomycetota bacterium]